MATSLQTLANASGTQATSSVPRLGYSLRGLWRAFWARRAKNATIAMLRGLDDRTLQDIGLDRSEIESVVLAKHHDRLNRYHHAWK